MPAKTVVFTSTRKFDGKDFRWITSGECCVLLTLLVVMLCAACAGCWVLLATSVRVFVLQSGSLSTDETRGKRRCETTLCTVKRGWR
jgi:hypothetical protein